MPRTIDYYFTLGSPWAFLGHQAFLDIANASGAIVRYKPLQLSEVFPHTGGLPLPKRHPARQRYRIMELQRWREARGIPLKLYPKHVPIAGTLPDRTIVALVEAGKDPGDYTRRAFAAAWVEDRNLADEETLAAVLNEAGHDGKAIVESAKSDAINTIYTTRPQEAVEANVIGSPCYVLDGEVFWGQDRLMLLESALKTGRKAYKMDATT